MVYWAYTFGVQDIVLINIVPPILHKVSLYINRIHSMHGVVFMMEHCIHD